MRAKLFITCLLVACSGSSTPGDDTFEQGDGGNVIKLPNEGMSTQGSRLLGENPVDSGGPDPIYHVSATTHATKDGEPIEVTFSGSATLASGKHVGMDPFFDGVVLQIEGGGELVLKPATGGSDITTYILRARTTPNDELVDPCRGGDAVPLAGRWTRTGRHDADPSHISFGCAGAVAYKCTIWGYTAGDDPTSPRWKRHQACTRMARADYCSDGHTHTRDGTLITIYDHVGKVGKLVPAHFDGLQQWPPPRGATTFEAAWNDGDEPTSCLSRVRWQSLPLGGVCGASTTLPDPRLSTDVKFCDDDDIAQNGRPILFNESRWTDLELYLWKNGNDLVSTVRGYYDDTGRSPDRTPFPNAGAYTFVGRDGMTLRSFITGQDQSDYDELRLFVKGTDHVIARRGDLPADYVSPTDEMGGFEGHVAKRALSAKFTSLDLYFDSVTGDAVTSTIDPGGNYVKDPKSPIGYLPRAETKQDTEPPPPPPE